MNIKDFKWTEKRFGTRFANILKKLGGLSKDGTDGSIEYKDEQGNVTKLVTDSNFSSLLAKNGVVEVTWQELKDRRDNGQLIPGSLYRITDYQCTTTQENTRSAGHQFDIVLLALSENKLAEEGWAMEHPTDVYDVTFATGETIKCYISQTYYVGDSLKMNLVRYDTHKGRQIAPTDIVAIDNVLKTATVTLPLFLLSVDVPYNYFQNSNLSAWKVWYCLDNDTARFAWADDSVDEDTPAYITIIGGKGEIYTLYRDSADDLNNLFAWKEGDSEPCYTASQTPSVGDTIYREDGTDSGFTVNSFTPAHEGTGLPNGRGVIYRLIDEFNNDIKYDFKNIQFNRTITDGQYDVNGTETWCYTLNVWNNDMCQDASIVGNTMPNDEGYIDGVYGNNFGYATAYDIHINGVDTFAFALGNNVVLSFYDEDDGYYGIFSNTIGSAFCKNTIGSVFRNNMIGNNFTNNIIGSWFTSNTIGNSFVNETISDNISFKNYGNNGVELATKDDLNA